MPRTLFVCAYENCASVFRHRERYAAHLRIHSGERPFICTYDNCDKSYRRMSHLKRHEESSHESNFKCNFPGCSMVLKTKDNLKKHTKIVHNKQSKKYKCDTCNQEFDKHYLLQVHKYTHTGIHPFVCSQPGCSKSFLMKCKLKQHMKCHKGYTCDQPDCEKIFFKWTLLRKHKKEDHVHTYTCQYCEKVFSLKSNFKRHALVHENEREIFKCDVPQCGRFYFAKKNLTYHLKHYHGQRPVACSYEKCNWFMKDQEELIKHVARRHPALLKEKSVENAVSQHSVSKKEEALLKPHLAEIFTGCVKIKYTDVLKLGKNFDTNNNSENPKELLVEKAESVNSTNESKIDLCQFVIDNRVSAPISS